MAPPRTPACTSTIARLADAQAAGHLAIIEFVDAADQPVSTGADAHHVLVTNLFNHTQPLIRYRLDDTMVPTPPADHHGHQRVSVEGRLDETISLGGTCIHPLVIRSVLLRHPQIAEYQVRSDTTALDVDIVTTATVDPDLLRDHLQSAVIDAGAVPALVTVRTVEGVHRDRTTGKVRRFITTDRSHSSTSTRVAST